jgi:hypothetical protein
MLDNQPRREKKDPAAFKEYLVSRISLYSRAIAFDKIKSKFPAMSCS